MFDSINISQLLILIFQCLIVSTLVLLLFRLRIWLGISMLYTALGLFQYMQVFLASTIYFEIANGIFISPGSSVLFSGSLFAILIVYIKEDAIETRKIIYSLFVTNLIMSLLLFVFAWHFKGTRIFNPLNVSSQFFDNNAWVLFAGTITLFIDSILILIIYEYVSKYIRFLFLSIWITMAIVLSFDTLCFTLLTFLNSINFKSILISGLIGKNGAIIIYSFIFYIYLKFIEKQKGFKKTKFRDIFYFLSYKQKYEILKEQKQEVEKAIEHSTIKYQTLTNMAPVGIFMTDASGYTIFVNPKWCEISGMKKDDALGYGWLNGLPKEDREIIENGWKNATDNKQSSTSEYRFVRPDGTIRWVLGQAIPELDYENNILGYIGTITDITEIKIYENELKKEKERAEKKEKRIKEQNEEIENFFTCTIDLLCIANTEGYFLRVNREWENLLGYSSDELVNKKFIDFIHPDDIEKTLMAVNELKNQNDIYHFTNRYKCKNGSYKWIEWKSHPVGNRIYAAARDITLRIEMENALIVKKEKAETSSKLKSMFLQNLSHEIRTPLNAICGFAQLLNNPNISTSKINEYSDIIQNSSEQLLTIVTDVLTMSSIETNQEKLFLKEIEVNSIIDEIYNDFLPKTEKKRLSFKTKKQFENLRIILADKPKLMQVLSNLLSNAIKFTNQGEIEYGYTVFDKKIQFFVKDTGIGISKEFHQKIFDRFIQADTEIQIEYGGTGLGLSISKGFVTLMGGEIWIESEPNIGSTFYFTIPYLPVSI